MSAREKISVFLVYSRGVIKRILGFEDEDITVKIKPEALEAMEEEVMKRCPGENIGILYGTNSRNKITISHAEALDDNEEGVYKGPCFTFVDNKVINRHANRVTARHGVFGMWHTHVYLNANDISGERHEGLVLSIPADVDAIERNPNRKIELIFAVYPWLAFDLTIGINYHWQTFHFDIRDSRREEKKDVKVLAKASEKGVPIQPAIDECDQWLSEGNIGPNEKCSEIINLTRKTRERKEKLEEIRQMREKLTGSEELSSFDFIVAAHAKDNKLLFSVDSKFQGDLDSSSIPKDLRQEFDNNKISLSDNPTVSIKEKDSRWLITDEDNRQEYTVRKEENKLNIYDDKIVPIHLELEKTLREKLLPLWKWSRRVSVTIVLLIFLWHTGELIWWKVWPHEMPVVTEVRFTFTPDGERRENVVIQIDMGGYKFLYLDVWLLHGQIKLVGGENYQPKISGFLLNPTITDNFKRNSDEKNFDYQPPRRDGLDVLKLNIFFRKRFLWLIPYKKPLVWEDVYEHPIEWAEGGDPIYPNPRENHPDEPHQSFQKQEKGGTTSVYQNSENENPLDNK